MGDRMGQGVLRWFGHIKRMEEERLDINPSAEAV